MDTSDSAPSFCGNGEKAHGISRSFKQCTRKLPAGARRHCLRLLCCLVLTVRLEIIFGFKLNPSWLFRCPRQPFQPSLACAAAVALPTVPGASEFHRHSQGGSADNFRIFKVPRLRAQGNPKHQPDQKRSSKVLKRYVAGGFLF